MNRTEFIRQKRIHTRKGQKAAYTKFIAVNVQNGKRTCGITLNRGRIAVGDDVWRMSNSSDMCEYPFRVMYEGEFNTFYRKDNPVYSMGIYEKIG